MKKDYYIGLDTGTSSVGWAASDEDYNLMRAKGHDLIGFRLFEEAKTAAERRNFRSSRRRLHRTNNRLKLLRILFEKEISKVDNKFYTRLRESFYLAEDKINLDNDKNTLFADKNYTDKDFHKEFPTIWHLRKALMDGSKHYDIRLYFLAIQHIFKHRGHFLYGGEIENVTNNFKPIFEDFIVNCQNYVYINEDKSEEFQEILLSKDTKINKKKQIKEVLELKSIDESISVDQLSGLFVGSKVNLVKLFNLDSDEKLEIEFSDNNIDEKIDEISQKIEDYQHEIIIGAKKIYDFVILKELLGESNSISEAMIRNYDKHQSELKELKNVLKPHKEEYDNFFKSNSAESYSAYLGKNLSEKVKKMDQTEINKTIVKILEKIGYSGDLLEKAKDGKLLPKQKGQAKGTIPMQLHRNELKLILDNLGKDYPSFSSISKSEPDEYNTKNKKIIQIHSFRVPYYCGPLVTKNNKDGQHSSEFSWADEETKQIVYPWNFHELVNLEDRAEKFIRRMTNNCTYLIGEDVLPKNSLSYEKYLVLNELNNLSINGQRITDVKLKQRIFEKAFLFDSAIAGNFKLKKFKKWLVDNSFISKDDELSGTNEDKYLPKLSTHQKLREILSTDYSKEYKIADLEKVIEAVTIIGDSTKICEGKIKKILQCNDGVANKLCKLNCKDWARFSDKLLNGIRIEIDGTSMTILEALYETNYNFMELLSHGFGKKIEEFNSFGQNENSEITYKNIKNLYCSPPVKRGVWQTVKIVQELISIIGYEPRKIFIEVTRSNEDDKTKKQREKLRIRRKEQLIDVLKNDKELLKELGEISDEKLQSKKMYLYFMQHGRCAYSGDRIDLEDLSKHDIDHIYPRSLTKDDSITNNLVLVKSELNREKTNTYPIDSSWQNQMRSHWLAWLSSGSITKEKYHRLTRVSPLTTEELSSFIARQIIETSQSTKAIADLFRKRYKNSKIVTVKAEQVSDLRHHFGYDEKDKSDNIYKKGMPEFIKIRGINDLHHAKDAYLNIVVGNVMDKTFTSDPLKWLKKKGDTNYTIRTEKLFRSSEYYLKKDNTRTNQPAVSGWNYQASIDIVSKNMKKNGVLWTRMPSTQSGEISDLQPVPRSKDRFPLKSNKRLSDTEKYGGYNSLKGAYFSLIECEDKKGNVIRKIIQIPIVYQGKEEQYLTNNYKNAKIIIKKILMKSLIEINGAKLHLAGRSGERLQFWHAEQLWFESKFYSDLKKILKISDNIKLYKKLKKEYQITDKYSISTENTSVVCKKLLEKLDKYKNVPGMGGKIVEIKSAYDDFTKLNINDQCEFISEIIKIFTCNPTTSDLSLLVQKCAHYAGNSISKSNELDPNDNIKLIHQSITGLITKEIDLNKIK